jgi:hypothetical protein|tara:strand:- start:1529 stop:2536 length:1008 start_codon:yes stop_codon:yes gene_type:complete
MSRNFKKFQREIDSLLFEDSYVTHGTIDNLRAGNIDISLDDEDPDIDLPIEPGPQAASQLSHDVPPVEDPEYIPANSKELSKALAALAVDIPDKTSIVQKTYEKFKKFVDDSQEESIDVDNQESKVEEARKLIKNQLLINIMKEQMQDRDAYGNRYDDEDPLGDLDGPSPEELEAMETPSPKKAEPTKDESTLADLAKDMGLSTSGVKRLEAEAVKKMRLFAVHFPDDADGVKELAMRYYAKGLYELELIDAEEAADLMSATHAYELHSFRQFMWDSFLNNVYKKMLRDADAQGISEDNLADLQPGLLDRATSYFNGLPDTKKMKVLVSSLGAAE